MSENVIDGGLSVNPHSSFNYHVLFEFLQQAE